MSECSASTTGQTLGLRRDRYLALTATKGWVRYEDQARGLGISQATISRTLAGLQRPGPSFIAALIVAFPESRFEDLFEVVDAIPRAVAS
jgi:hypothetical protein